MIATISTELKPFEDLAATFATKELVPNKEENDKYPFGEFFGDVLEKAYEVGFLGTTLPEEYGGIGQGISALCVILDNICQSDTSLGGIVFTSALSQELMLSAESKDLLTRITSDATQAKDLLIAFPAFDNPPEMKNMADAKRDKNNYTLSGNIEYLTLGGLAAHALIPAKTKDRDGYSFFLIDLSDEGATKSGPIFSLGLHACPSVDLRLNEVKGELVGKEGLGAGYFEEVSDKMHVAAAAMSAGIMKGSFNEALAYSQERFQGGWEIINWSEIKMMLANMAVQVKIADMTIAQACQGVENKEPQWGLCSRAAALHIQDMACNLTTDGIQVLGGNGYMKDYGQEKRFRDAKQVQALLGLTPMKKIRYIERIIEQ